MNFERGFPYVLLNVDAERFMVIKNITMDLFQLPIGSTCLEIVILYSNPGNLF